MSSRRSRTPGPGRADTLVRSPSIGTATGNGRRELCTSGGRLVVIGTPSCAVGITDDKYSPFCNVSFNLVVLSQIFLNG
jgi:hypothetical protein